MMNEDLAFSKFMEDDLEEVAKLYDEERPTVTNRVKMKETFEKIKDKPEYKMIVVKNNGSIIGFAKAIIHYDIFEENNPFVTIWSVRVKKEYRRLKVGTKLFEYIEKIAKDMNCEFICLIADKNNTVANQFYKSLGYECESGYVKFLRGLN
ncbi:MAG: GNAT family N-acetyltransferase [Clostridia bacterium]|nr:GNAT family N-acetyltransferase [Clostridia bacterium]